LLHQSIGGGFNGWATATTLAVISFLLMLGAEYEKEKNRS
jgi:hypothetical protein